MKKNNFSGKYFVILLAATSIIAIIVAFNIINSKSYQKEPVNTELTKIETQSKDTELESIEEDLNNTKFDTLDKELQDIDTEINTSL